MCSPEDAYKCFMRTEMDVLVIQNQIIFLSLQPKLEKKKIGKKNFPSSDNL